MSVPMDCTMRVDVSLTYCCSPEMANLQAAHEGTLESMPWQVTSALKGSEGALHSATVGSLHSVRKSASWIMHRNTSGLRLDTELVHWRRGGVTGRGGG